MLLNLVMVTAIFAQVDLIFVVIFRKKFLSLTFPMILQYLSERLTDLWNGQLWKIYLENGNLDFFNRYSSFVMFLPSNQLSMYSTFPYHTNLSVAVYYMILLLVFFVLVFIFHMLLERRWFIMRNILCIAYQGYRHFIMKSTSLIMLFSLVYFWERLVFPIVKICKTYGFSVYPTEIYLHILSDGTQVFYHTADV